MIMKQRTSLVAAMVIVLVTGFARSALCQGHSTVFYEDFNPIDTTTYMTEVGFDDYSTCGHSGYWHDLWAVGPNGGFAQTSGYFNTENPIAFSGDGNYDFSSSLSVDWCSCGGGPNEGLGGGSASALGGTFLTHYILGGEGETYYYYFRDDTEPSNAHRCAKSQAVWSDRHDEITQTGIWAELFFGFGCMGSCDPQRFGVAHGPSGVPPEGIQPCRTFP
jgi:hypothetical protein